MPYLQCQLYVSEMVRFHLLAVWTYMMYLLQQNKTTFKNDTEFIRGINATFRIIYRIYRWNIFLEITVKIWLYSSFLS